MQNIIRVFIATALILMVPFVAMQFESGVNWNLADFVIMGSLLVGTGLIYVFATRKMVSNIKKVLIGIALAVALFIIWIDLAVGIFNIPGFSGS